jgi:transcriptional regulator with XRE-family HTH domain
MMKGCVNMFWDVFYELCKLQNTTPNAVCAVLGYSTATATHWKNGTIPKGDALLKIADYFNVSVDYLLGKSDLKTPDEELSQEQFALWGEVKDLTEEEKKKVLDFIKFTKSQREV